MAAVMEVRVHCQNYETDFGWRQSWSCPTFGNWANSRRELQRAMALPVSAIVKAGMSIKIRYTQSKMHLPEGW